MNDNYYDTAQRMYLSSKTLHEHNQYHNACYLAGYIVECYGKIILGKSELTLTYNELKSYVHNLKEINKELRYILDNATYLGNYIIDNLNTSVIVNGQNRWDANSRYKNVNNEYNHQNSSNYQSEIERIMQVLTQMKIDLTTLI